MVMIGGIRHLEPEEVTCVNPMLNVFKAYTGDFTFTVKQPRSTDYNDHWRAWRKLSDYTLLRYKRKYVDEKHYDSKYRCNLPIYKGEVPGWLPLVMVIQGNIVGFGDMMFKHGTEYMIHDVGDDEVGCSMNLCVLDKYQGMGVGSYYGHLSIFIARFFGADYALGYTPFKKGMFHIRMKDDWEYVERRGDWAVIQKRL